VVITVVHFLNGWISKKTNSKRLRTSRTYLAISI